MKARHAGELSDAAPVDFMHSRWYVSEYDDPAMIEVDPDAFKLIKETMSDTASKDGIFAHQPIELWADYLRWWE